MVPNGEVAICLSGGGVRAMLFGLGALRAVIAGIGAERRLTTLAAVSGGSIGVAFAAHRLDPADTSLEDFDQNVLRPAFTAVTRRSLMWSARSFWAVVLALVVLLGAVVGCLLPLCTLGPARLVWPVGAGLMATVGVCLGWRRLRGRAVVLAVAFAIAATAVGIAVCSLDLPSPARAGVRVGGALVALALALWVFSLRGAAIERGMRAVLFAGRSSPALSDLADRRLRLVFTATDLSSGEAAFLTPEGIESGRWGTATAAGIPLVRAVRASATFPFVFPALRLPVRQFSGGLAAAARRRLPLVDGGVYDNMGTEWLLSQRRLPGGQRVDRIPAGTYKIIVNASRNLPPTESSFAAFGIGEIQVILREKDIQYDATTAPRRRWLRQIFRLGRARGTLVRIDADIRAWVESFATVEQADPRRERAREMLAALDEGRTFKWWRTFAGANAQVATSLDRLPVETALNLIRGGYLATAIQLFVLEAWPRPETVDPERLFVEWR